LDETPLDSSEVQSFHFPDFGNAANVSPARETNAPAESSCLRVEYGRTEVLRTNSDQWQAGMTIVLPQEHADLVAILVDGSAIARGELVEMDGKLGVRILELISSSNVDERRSA